MAPRPSASISAASSTMGPREVFTSVAVGFMRASSGRPTRWRVRSESTRWMLTTSAVAKSSSLSTRRAPCSAARSSVRLALQATTSMPKACPTRATRVPMLPRPRSPSVRPSRSAPTAVCQPPARTEATSPGRRRATARMSAQVSSAVLLTIPHVPETTMPSSLAAPTSMAALRSPVVTSSRRSGSRSSTALGNAVRSRMATTTSQPRSRSTRSSTSATWSVNETTSRAAGHSTIDVATSW